MAEPSPGDVAILDGIFSSDLVSNGSSGGAPLPTDTSEFQASALIDPSLDPATPSGDAPAANSPPTALPTANSAGTDTAPAAGQGGGVVSAYQPAGSTSFVPTGTTAGSAIQPLTNQQAQAIASQSAAPAAVSPAPAGPAPGGAGPAGPMMSPPGGPPVANNDSYTASGGSLATTPANGVLANDSANGNGTLTAVLRVAPTHGILDLHSDGSFTYAASAGYSGLDSFTYYAVAGMQPSNAATVSLAVTTTPPVANNDAYSVTNDALTTTSANGVLANDSSNGNGTLSAVLATSPSHGMVAFNGDGSFTYTANTRYSGPDSFTYRDTAGMQTSNTATVSLTVSAGAAPVANNDSYSVMKGALTTTAANGVLTNDSSNGNGTLTASVVATTSHGMLSLNGDGSFTYTANPGYAGPESFTYRDTAGMQTSNTATVTLTSATPTANADAYTLPPGGTALVVSAPSGVLANDAGPAGVSLSAVLVAPPGHGTVSLGSDGSFTYTPTPGSSGADSFTYQASAGGLTSNTATVTLTIAAAVLPTANDDAYTLPTDGTPLVVSATSGVLANDVSPTGQPLTAALVAPPSNGTLILNADGSFTFTASPSFNGSDSFTYTATAGGLTSNTATVTLLVGLVGVPDSYTVQHDDSLQTDATNGVLANDSNAGGSALQASLVSGPQHGTLGLNADGSFLYTPTPGYAGADSFTYRAQADGKTTGPVLVSLDVTDQAPEVQDTSFTAHAGQTLQVGAAGLGSVCADPDIGDSLTYGMDAGPAHGQLQLAPDGSFTYTPNAGFVGTETFTYHANDGALNSPTSGTVSIYVTDAAPLAGNVSFDVAANGVLNDPTKSVLSNTADTDGDAVTAHLQVGPAHASQFAVNANGTFVYAPAPNFVGTDTFTFVANDGTLDSAQATVTINVSAGAVPHDHYYVLPPSGPLTVSAADGLLNDAFNPTGYPIQAVLVGLPSSGSVQITAGGGFVYTPPVGGPPQADVTFQFTIPTQGQVTVATAKLLLALFPPAVSLLTENFINSTAGGPNGKVFAITPDKGGKALSTGWSSADMNTRNPVTLVAGGTYNLVDTFSVDNPKLFTNLIGVLQFDVTSTFLAPAVNGLTPTVTVAGTTMTATWKNVPAPAKASVNDTVNATYQLVWPTWATFNVNNTGKHQIYVLAGAPAGGVTLFHTVVRVGTLATQGMAATTAADKAAVITKIEGSFGVGKDVERVDGTVLTYYGNWNAATKGNPAESRTVATLLAKGDGNCQAWSSFLVSVLRAQGIGDDLADLYKLETKYKRDGLLLVKNWTLRPGALPINQFTMTGIDFATPGYTFLPGSGVVKAAGIAAKGNANPLALFGTHEIIVIKVGTAKGLFDPSYGTSASDLTDYAVKSFDFVGAVLYNGTTGISTLSMAKITKANAATYVRPKP